MTSWEFPKIPIEKKLDEGQSLPNYSGELAVSFTSYPRVDLSTSTVYFKAPKDFLRNQINSYGGNLNYQITYSGYSMENVPTAPDIFIVGNDITLLYHSGQKPRPNEGMTSEDRYANIYKTNIVSRSGNFGPLRALLLGHTLGSQD